MPNPESFIGRFARSIESGWVGKIIAVEKDGNNDTVFKMQGVNLLVYLIEGKSIHDCLDKDDTQWFAPADVEIVSVSHMEKPAEFEARMEQEGKDANTGNLIALGVLDE